MAAEAARALRIAGGVTRGGVPWEPGLAPVAAMGEALGACGLRANAVERAEVMEAYAVQAVSRAIADGGASAVEFEIRKLQAQAVQDLGKGQNGKLVLIPTDVVSSLGGSLGQLAQRWSGKD